MRANDIIKVVVNGQAHELAENSTVADVLGSLHLEGRHVAVELNFEILGREKYQSLHLQEGDRLEIVHAIGGGAWQTRRETDPAYIS